ncbi:pyridoxal kinase, partial [Vibrio parahaemolyticus VPTS-2010_2]
NSIGV